MDITNDEQVEAVVHKIESESGSVDILVNNTGFGMYHAAKHALEGWSDC